MKTADRGFHQEEEQSGKSQVTGIHLFVSLVQDWGAIWVLWNHKYISNSLGNSANGVSLD